MAINRRKYTIRTVGNEVTLMRLLHIFKEIKKLLWKWVLNLAVKIPENHIKGTHLIPDSSS